MTALIQYVIAIWLIAMGTHALAQEGVIAETGSEMRVSKETIDGLDWYDVTQWGVEGRILPEQTRQQWFDRLPASAEKSVTEAVWRLSQDSAGMMARFKTDSQSIHVHYKLKKSNLAMAHMPATGVSGVDLYARDDNGSWRWVQVTRPNSQEIKTEIVSGLAAGEREYAAYLPLYNGVEFMSIGVEHGSNFEGLAPRNRPIVFYGTSITHGACASRPGMVHTAILGRWLDRPIVNLGFSGNGRMDKEVGDYLTEIDAAALVIDCLPNMGPDDVAKKCVPLVRQLRTAHPLTPIVLVEDRRNTNDWILPRRQRHHTLNHAALREAYATLIDEGVTNLHYIPGDRLYGEDGEGATDGSHASDLGFMRQAEVFEPILRRAITGDAAHAPVGETGSTDSWKRVEPYFSPPAQWQGKLGDYHSPLEFSDATRVQSADDWDRRRAEIRSEWVSLLGPWPALITEPQVKILQAERRENITQYQVSFDWVPNEQTTGYLLIPDGESPRPAVVTVFYEPETAIGLGVANRDFALQLARRGFVTLSIGTTDASQAKTYSLYYPSIDDAQVAPLSMLGYAAANAWYVLADRPEVDASRIGIVGHSFGGKWAMFASCLFDKFACAAWSDPGIVFDEGRESVNYWEPWYLGYHPKPWRKRGLITADNPAFGLYPKLRAANHDLQELHALMAPRPLLVSGGSEDPPRRWEALNHLIEINRILGYSNRVGMTNRPEHAPNDESNEIIYAFFEHFLIASPTPCPRPKNEDR